MTYSLLSACQAASGVPCLVSIAIIQERCGQTGKGPKEDHEGDHRAGQPAL